MKGLLGSGLYFRYPKPVWLIKRCIQFFSAEDSLVLDFFVDSAATAHAVMELNAQLNGNRKYILVQAFERKDNKDTAYRDRYTCETVKEQLRLAGRKVREENPDVRVDTGFRVYRVENVDMEKD